VAFAAWAAAFVGLLRMLARIRGDSSAEGTLNT
jgi:hypothetical protein